MERERERVWKVLMARDVYFGFAGNRTAQASGMARDKF